MNFLFTLFKHLSSIYQQYSKTSCLKVCASDCVKNRTLKNCIFWGKVSQRNFMESNKSRGTRSLFWMKVNLVAVVLICILGLIVTHQLTASGYSMQQFSSESPDIGAAMNFMYYIIVMAFSGFVMLLVWSIFQFFWLLWLFRAEKNLRLVAMSKFSPWGAVICSSIPYIGFLIHYFIFKDLVKQTESALESRRQSSSKTVAEILSKVSPVDNNFVNGFAIMTVLAAAIGFIRDTSISGFLAVAFSVASLLCYMKSFAAFIKEEQALFDIYQEEKLMAKVDQVLWQRKLESESADEKTKV